MRRLRSDVREEAGQDFPERALIEHRLNATSAEEAAFESLLEIPFTLRGEHRPGRNHELLRVGTQKGLFSSPAAAIVSAQRRIEALTN